jgi:hypothetical protein
VVHVDRQQVDAARGTLGARRGDIAPDTSSIAPPAAERSGARRTYNAALAPLGRAHVGRQQIEAARRTLRGRGNIAFDTPNTPCASGSFALRRCTSTRQRRKMRRWPR